MIIQYFKKKSEKELFENEFPEYGFNWLEPWWSLEDNLRAKKGIQKEIHLEIGPKHPLSKLQPIVFAKCAANDDVLVFLNDGRFACLHLVWHGKIDQFPDKFPSTHFLNTKEDVQKLIDEEAEDHT